MLRAVLFCVLALLGQALFGQDVRPYVGKVLSKIEGGYSAGSCVIIDDDLVLTNHHVIRDTRGVVLVFGDRQLPAKVLKSDEVFDLALIQFEGKLAPNQHRIGIGDSEEWATTCGFANGITYKEVTGKLVAYIGGVTQRGRTEPCLTRDGEPAMFVFKGRVIQGMSGGPMVGESGYLTGLVWGSLEGEMYGTRVPAILEFLEGTPGEPRVFLGK